MKSHFFNWTNNIRNLYSGVYHRHFGDIAEGPDGNLYMVCRRASKHGTIAPGSISLTIIEKRGGGTQQAEQILLTAPVGRDYRDLTCEFLDDGTFVIHFADVPSVASATGPVYFKLISKPLGGSWTSPSAYDTINFGNSINFGAITKDSSGRHIKPGYKKVSSSPNTYTTTTYAATDGLNYVEDQAIYLGPGGYNESGVAYLNENIRYAVARGTGLNMFVPGAGNTWTMLPVPTWDNSDCVAPTVNIVYALGIPYVFLGYCDRDKHRMVWRWAKFEDALKSADAFAYNYKEMSTDMDASSGYQRPIFSDTGEFIYVEFVENTTDDTTKVRLIYANYLEMIMGSSREFIPRLRGTGTPGTPTYLARYGFAYKDMAGMVHGMVRIDVSDIGGLTAQLVIDDLPWPAEDDPAASGFMKVAFIAGHSTGSYKEIVGRVKENERYMQLYMIGSSGLPVSFTDANVFVPPSGPKKITLYLGFMYMSKRGV